MLTPHAVPSSRTPRTAWAWLALGAALIPATHLTGGVGALAWVAPVPLMRFLRLSRGWPSRLALVAAVVAGWVIATAKIVTWPLPAAFSLVGAGIALGPALGLLAWDQLRDRPPPALRIWLWPAIMALVDLAMARWSPLGVWGTTANTQLGDLPLLQIASLGGAAAVGALVQLVASAIDAALAARLDGAAPPRRAAIAAVAGLVVAAHAFGAWRLSRPLGATVAVATVDTTARFTGFDDLPDATERAAILERLLADTARAARAGARIVVWTEAATVVDPGADGALVAAVRALAARERVDVLVPYIALVAGDRAHFRNEYAWVRADGAVDHVWRKHHLPPGEPSLAGDEAAVAVAVDGLRAAGAICYDYDFPSLVAEHGALGVDLVAVPSSDWRGIDPIHTEMVALRAIEQGMSIARSTRFGLSSGVDPHGRLRGWRSAADGSDRVMLVSLPARGVATLYRRTGDAPLAAAATLLLLAAVRRRR